MVKPQGRATRHPSKPWTREELILALDLYLRRRQSPPGPEDADTIALTRILSALWGAARGEEATFRNANGVAMKLMNFRSHDPEFLAKGRKGLQRGNRLEAVVWNEFANDKSRLREVSASIRALVSTGTASALSLAEDDEDEEDAAEGRTLSRLHKTRERSAKLRRKKKLDALRRHGKLSCEVCTFDFAAAYGSRGQDFIECHHTSPLAALVSEVRTKLSDLALLCSNCHRMIHRRSPWLSLEELRGMMIVTSR